MSAQPQTMKILVLGGSGFIGTRLVTQLITAGHTVRIFDKAASTAHPDRVTLGDVRDAAAVARAMANCDCAINLAAEHRDDVRPAALYFDVNVGGAKNIVQSAEANGVKRLIFVSSVSVYGFAQPMANETSALVPGNDYGRSKAQAEAVYADWHKAVPAQRSLTVLRPCVIFGEGNRGNVHNLIDHIRRGRFVMVGNGRNKKSIAYVGNLVDFLIAQLHNPSGSHLYNYADKPDLSTQELVCHIHAALPGKARNDLRVPYTMAIGAGYLFDALALALIRGRPFSISSQRVRKFCADTTIAVDAAERSGFQPRVGLVEGLGRTIAALLREGA